MWQESMQTLDPWEKCQLEPEQLCFVNVRQAGAKSWKLAFHRSFWGRAKKSRVKAMSKHEMMLTRNVATYLLAETLIALLFQIQ